MTVELYGKMPDGTDVHRITLKGAGLSANVLHMAVSFKTSGLTGTHQLWC